MKYSSSVCFSVMLIIVGVMLLATTIDSSDRNKTQKQKYVISASSEIALMCSQGFTFAVTDKGGITQVIDVDGRPLECGK